MKKFLGIVVLCLLLSTNAYSACKKEDFIKYVEVKGNCIALFGTKKNEINKKQLIILLIFILIIRFLLQLLKHKEPYVIIAIAGLICSYGIQSLINIFSTLGIIPTKGMTLPFISYGGSSMISSSILFGFLLSLTKQKK